MQIQLKRTWDLGQLIGGGGFGRVFLAEAQGVQAVVKLVPKEPGADRELLFVDLEGVRNVVPVIEAGETENEIALVMPKADKSLQQYMDEVGLPVAPDDVLPILTDIATALLDMEQKVVHRDLKPHNVLLLGGKWCIADFGIARYAEASTAPETHKYAMSAPWAAPERWRMERATSATDVYAFGIIAYELLAGRRPFAGNRDQLREAHLSARVPPLQGVSLRLASLVEECLDKSPGARPSAANLVARLKRAAEAPRSPGLAGLHGAHQTEIHRQQERSREAAIARAQSEERAALVQSARVALPRIVDTLKEAIQDAAPAAQIQGGRDGSWSLSLGQARLEVAGITSSPAEPWAKWNVNLNVVAHSSIKLTIPQNRYGYEGRSHSLWYCDAAEEGRYKWYEVAFMFTPMGRRSSTYDPFALPPGDEAGRALWNGMAEYQVAWSFVELIDDEIESFIDRWANWLAQAAQGTLNHPSSMPERGGSGAWRRR